MSTNAEIAGPARIMAGRVFGVLHWITALLAYGGVIAIHGVALFKDDGVLECVIGIGIGLIGLFGNLFAARRAVGGDLRGVYWGLLFLIPSGFVSLLFISLLADRAVGLFWGWVIAVAALHLTLFALGGPTCFFWPNQQAPVAESSSSTESPSV
jgi:hypothetical protein